MKKVISLLLCVLMVCVSISALAAQKVGVSMPTKDLQRWIQDGDNMKAELEAAGYEVDLQYASNDVQQQLNQVTNMINGGCEVVVIAAIEGSSLGSALDLAKEKGIPVIAYDRLLMESDAVSYYATFDNYQVGVKQGTYIIEQLDLENAEGPFYLEVTAGDPGDNNALFFYNGAMDLLKPYIESGKLIVKSNQVEFADVATPAWKTETSQNRASSILSSYYADGSKIDAWMCSNDSTALGVAKAIEDNYAGENEIIVTGQDGDIANLANIVDGKQTMTVYKNVANEAIVTLELAKAMLAGDIDGAALAQTFGIECVFDTESYETSAGVKCPSFLLVPSVITKDNLQDLVDTGLYTMGADGYLAAAN